MSDMRTITVAPLANHALKGYAIHFQRVAAHFHALSILALNDGVLFVARDLQEYSAQFYAEARIYTAGRVYAAHK